MATLKRTFLNDSFYHLVNRGVEQRKIFLNNGDYNRFLQLIFHYQYENASKYSTSNDESLRLTLKKTKNGESKKIVNILCYCLMPNHFHLLVEQVRDKGITRFTSQIQNSYTRYFNTKNQRVGPLFQGNFKSVTIETDEQFIHVSRYIHLNPFVSSIVENPKDYRWSSYNEYLTNIPDHNIYKEPILAFFEREGSYERFVMNHADYAKSLEKIKHRLLDH